MAARMQDAAALLRVVETPGARLWSSGWMRHATATHHPPCCPVAGPKAPASNGPLVLHGGAATQTVHCAPRPRLRQRHLAHVVQQSHTPSRRTAYWLLAPRTEASAAALLQLQYKIACPHTNPTTPTHSRVGHHDRAATWRPDGHRSHSVTTSGARLTQRDHLRSAPHTLCRPQERAVTLAPFHTLLDRNAQSGHTLVTCSGHTSHVPCCPSQSTS
jgi:hypothetical protein